MENSFKHIIDLIISIFLIVLFPLLIINQHKDVIIQTVVEDNVNTFVDTISIKGYISKNMYEELSNKIRRLSSDYQIFVEHEERIYYPNYKLMEAQVIVEQVRVNQGIHNGISDEIFLNSDTDEILYEIYANKRSYYIKQGDLINVELLDGEGFTLYKQRQVVRGGS